MKQKRFARCLGLAVVLGMAFAMFSIAQVPQLINYQGVLTNSAGSPINGTQSIKFSIYSSAAGGSVLWTETQSVSVQNGLFNVLLGSITSIPYSVFDASERYLALKVGSDAEMTPRKRLVSTGYSFKANDADHLNGRTIPSVVSSVAGVTNDGGNVDIVAGSNVTVTPDDANNKITISASGGGVSAPLNLTGDMAWPNAVITGTTTSNGRGLSGVSASGIGIYGEGKTGMYGNSTRADGFGVTGHGNTGVEGVCEVGTGNGVVGSSTNGYGVKGTSTNNYGVVGEGTYGVLGTSSSYHGVVGKATAANGCAIYGYRADGGDWAGRFDGNVKVNGSITVTGSVDKHGGTFKIDHPLDPANKYLSHSFVESPDMMNIYNGNAVLDSRGEATVKMPDWFEALNQDFRYQLTAMGAPGPNLYIAEEISGNRFRIAGGVPNMKVSWQVTGIRHDAWANAHRTQVEVAKTGDERGRYSSPIEYGMPESLGIGYSETQQMVKAAGERP